MDLKPTLQHYTRAEFSTLIESILNFETLATEHDRLVDHFDRVCGHPEGADLLFYPRRVWGGAGVRRVDSVLDKLKQSANSRGLPAFSDDTVPTPPAPPARLTAQQRAQQRVQRASLRNLERAQQLAAKLDQAEQQAVAALDRMQAFIDSNDQSSLRARLDAFDDARYGMQAPLGRYTGLAQETRFAFEWARDAVSSANGDPGLDRQVLQMAEAARERYAAQEPDILERCKRLTQRAFDLAQSLQQRLIQQVHEQGLAPGTLAHHFTAPLAGVDGLPRLLTPHIGPARILEGQMPGFRRSIRSAVAGMFWQASQGAPAANQSRVIAFQYDRPGAGEPFALCVPLSELMPVEGYDWSWLAEAAGHVNLPIRAASGWVDAGVGNPPFSRQAQICLIDTGNAMAEASVAVVAARAVEGGYRFTSPGVPAHHIDWVTGSASIAGTPHAGNVITPPMPLIEPLAPGLPVRSDDYVVVFPEQAGIGPLYVLFKGAHEYPAATSVP